MQFKGAVKDVLGQQKHFSPQGEVQPLAADERLPQGGANPGVR